MFPIKGEFLNDLVSILDILSQVREYLSTRHILTGTVSGYRTIFKEYNLPTQL